MTVHIETRKVIEVADWDALVIDTYGRPYNFQQQDGCKPRGTFQLSVPSENSEDNDWPDSVPEVVNHEQMGVNFAAWLARDPKQSIENGRVDYGLVLWWERNFYPPIQAVANDLHSKGLLEAGEYTIDIDW